MTYPQIEEAQLGHLLRLSAIAHTPVVVQLKNDTRDLVAVADATDDTIVGTELVSGVSAPWPVTYPITLIYPWEGTEVEYQPYSPVLGIPVAGTYASASSATLAAGKHQDLGGVTMRRRVVQSGPWVDGEAL